MVQVLVFGTSTTYGCWDKEGGWVQRLRKTLDKRYIEENKEPHIVYNLGISGDTSRDILGRFEFESAARLKSQAEEKEDVIIVISVGVNDSLFNVKTKKQDIALEEYAFNVENILKLAKNYTKKVIFVGNKPVDDKRTNPWWGDWSYKSEIVEKYDAKAKEICKTNGIQFIDVYKEFKKTKNYEKLLSDGVHPTTKGHKLIFDVVKRELIKNKILKDL